MWPLQKTAWTFPGKLQIKPFKYFNFLWEFHKMYFDHLPLAPLLQDPPFQPSSLYPPNFEFSSILLSLTSVSIDRILPQDVSWNVTDLTGVISLTKADSPSLRSYQTPMNPQLVVRILFPQSLSVVRSWLAWGWAGPVHAITSIVSLYVQSPRASGNTFCLPEVYNFWLLKYFFLISQNISLPRIGC